MDGLLGRRGLMVLVLAACATSCSRHDQELLDHQKALASVAASVNRIADAWLRGDISGTYTATALRQMLVSCEQERTAVASAPALMADPRGAALADSASTLSAHVAQMIVAVHAADARAIRDHVAALPFVKAS